MTWGIRWKVFCFFSLCVSPAPSTPQKEIRSEVNVFLKTPLDYRITLERVRIRYGQDAGPEPAALTSLVSAQLWPKSPTGSYKVSL